MKQVLLERYGSPAEAVRGVDVPYDTARYQRLHAADHHGG